jgi:pimeloyl-ACP methyl ester carboxylesterase
MGKAAIITLLLAAVLLGQPYTAGPQVLTYVSDVDDSVQPYGLYLPRNFDASRKYPLVISLHGDFSNHRLVLRQVFGIENQIRATYDWPLIGPRQMGAFERRTLRRETDSEAANGPFPPFPNVDFIVATPLARGSMGYQGIAEKDVYDVLAEVKKRFPIDEDRIYLTGLAMGGGGTLWLGLTRPDVWAAIAAACPVAPQGTEELAPNALNLPVRLFQGALDPLVPVDVSRGWNVKLRDAGARVEYTEYPVVKHNSWEEAYKNAAIFNWFAGFRRDRFPERVRFTTRSYAYRSAYWVELDGLTPGNLASIDVKFTGPNQIEVQTTGLEGFTLRPAGHPLCDSSRPVSVKVDGTTLKAGPRPALSFSRTEKGWKEALYVPPAGWKRPGAEGPIREAVSRRHLYVYGTADSPDETELKRRRAQAEFAAKWVDTRQPLLLSLRAVPDKEALEAASRGADLVLFGVKETNSLIARLVSVLPIELNPGAADYGLVFIAPAPNGYVLVNSGLPWWTGAEGDRREVFPFTPPPYSFLTGFGDFILFKGSLKNVVAEGRFDRNWKVPAEQAAKMAATGTVQIR